MSNKESLKYFEQRGDMIWFAFSQDHSGLLLRIDWDKGLWRGVTTVIAGRLVR